MYKVYREKTTKLWRFEIFPSYLVEARICGYRFCFTLFIRTIHRGSILLWIFGNGNFPNESLELDQANIRGKGRVKIKKK